MQNKLKTLLLIVLLFSVSINQLYCRTIKFTPQSRNIFRQLEKAQKGDTYIFSSGKYKFKKAISFENKSNVKLIGIGRVSIITTKGSENVIDFFQCKNIVIKNIHFVHMLKSHDTYCDGSVMVLNECNNVTVDKCILSGCGIVGITVQQSNNVNIRNNYIHNNRIYGVEIKSSNRVVIQNNEFRDNTQNIKYSLADNVVLKNNKFRYRSRARVGRIIRVGKRRKIKTIEEAFDIVRSNDTIMLDAGIYWINRNNYRLEKLELSYCKDVKIIGGKNVKIENSSQPPRPIYFTNCYNLKIVNVIFQSAIFYRCKKLQLTRCKFAGAPEEVRPVTFQECNNVRIVKCKFIYFMGRPCIFIGTNNVTFIKNKIENNASNVLFSYCKNVKLLRNTFISEDSVNFYGCRKIILRNNYPSIIPKQILNKKYKTIGIVIGRVVNVRTKPSLRSSVVFKVKENQRVVILSKTSFMQKIAGTKAKWYKIKTSRGNIGYVFGAFVFEVNSLFTSSWNISYLPYGADPVYSEGIKFRRDGIFIYAKRSINDNPSITLGKFYISDRRIVLSKKVITYASSGSHSKKTNVIYMNIKSLTNQKRLFFNREPNNFRDIYRGVVIKEMSGFSKHIKCKLVQAVKTNNIIRFQKILKKLGNYYSEDVNSMVINGSTLLIYSIFRGYTKIVKKILLPSLNLINVQDMNGNTPLIAAVKTNNIEIVKLLLKRENDLTIRNGQGKTAIDVAREKNNKQILKLLLNSL